jgi:NADH-quinone oxidoreductase subunit C
MDSDMTLEEIRRQLDDALPGAVTSGSSLWGEATLMIQLEQIQPVCRFLRDALSFNFLVDLCGLDQYPREPRFGVVYHLCAMDRRERLRLKVFLLEADPRVDSVSTVWKAADWLEREVFDMFGIRFDGHPNLQRILTPPGWEGYPLRKDYPLKGVQSS